MNEERNCCPLVREKREDFFWSGGDSLRAIFTSGYSSSDTLIEKPKVDLRPKSQTIQCKSCKSKWFVTYKWPDRPPCMATGKLMHAEG